MNFQKRESGMLILLYYRSLLLCLVRQDITKVYLDLGKVEMVNM